MIYIYKFSSGIQVGITPSGILDVVDVLLKYLLITDSEI